MWEMLRGFAENVSLYMILFSLQRDLRTDSGECAVSGEALSEISISSTDEFDGDVAATAALGGDRAASARHLSLGRANIHLNSTTNSSGAAIDTGEGAHNTISAGRDVGDAQNIS